MGDSHRRLNIPLSFEKWRSQGDLTTCPQCHQTGLVLLDFEPGLMGGILHFECSNHDTKVLVKTKHNNRGDEQCPQCKRILQTVDYDLHEDWTITEMAVCLPHDVRKDIKHELEGYLDFSA